MQYWFLLIHYSELKEEYDSVALPHRVYYLRLAALSHS